MTSLHGDLDRVEHLKLIMRVPVPVNVNGLACMRARREPWRAPAATLHTLATYYLGVLLCFHAVRFTLVGGGAEAAAHTTPTCNGKPDHADCSSLTPNFCVHDSSPGDEESAENLSALAFKLREECPIMCGTCTPTASLSTQLLAPTHAPTHGAVAAAVSACCSAGERDGLATSNSQEESIEQGPDVCSRSVAEESQHARDITKGRTEMDSRQVGTLIRMADVRAPVVRAADARSSGSTAARGTGWPNSTCGCLRFFMLGELFTGAKSLLHWVNTDPAVYAPPSLERFDLSWTQDRVKGNLFARVRALRLLVTLVLLP